MSVPACAESGRGALLKEDLRACPRLWVGSLKGMAAPRGLAVLASAGGAVVLLDRYDGRVARELQRGSLTRRHFRFGDAYGNAAQYGGLQAALYLTGLGLKRDGLREFGALAFHSAVLSGALTGALKLAVGTRRPDGSGGGRFDSSFPSGHAAGSAALAGTVHGRYGTLRALPFHLAAAYTGVSRVVENHHRPSEVAAGWGLGYAAGWAVARAWNEDQAVRRLSLGPWTSPAGGTGLAFRLPFGAGGKER